MELEDVRPAAEGATKRKKDEVARGRRKQRKEDDFRPGKRVHSPSVSRRTPNPERFYFEDWNEVQEEEDE